MDCFETMENMVKSNSEITCAVALTGASAAMCGAIGSKRHTKGELDALNAVATIAGVGGSVLVGTHIIVEHLGDKTKNLDKLYGLMALPVLAVGAVRLASSFMDDKPSNSSSQQHSGSSDMDDLADELDILGDILDEVKDIYDLSGNDITLTNIKKGLQELIGVLEDSCGCTEYMKTEIKDVIKKIEAGTYASVAEALAAAKEVAKETASDSLDELISDADCRPEIEALLEVAAGIFDEGGVFDSIKLATVIAKVTAALALAEKD